MASRAPHFHLTKREPGFEKVRSEKKRDEVILLRNYNALFFRNFMSLVHQSSSRYNGERSIDDYPFVLVLEDLNKP